MVFDYAQCHVSDPFLTYVISKLYKNLMDSFILNSLDPRIVRQMPFLPCWVGNGKAQVNKVKEYLFPNPKVFIL